MRTYTGDVHGLVREQKLSLARMVASERPEPTTNTPRQPSPSNHDTWRRMVFIGVALLVAVVAAVVAMSVYYNHTTAGPTVERDLLPALLFTEMHKDVEMRTSTPGGLIRTLATTNIQTSLAVGLFADFSVVRTDTSSSDVTRITQVRAQEFMRALNPALSDDFINVLNEQYVVGIHSLDSGNQPFIMLSTNVYGNAFSGMIAWERSMAEDLSPFFDRGVPFTLEEIAVNGHGAFTDMVVQNMDVRVLRDAQENIVLAYTFVDRGTIVIASDIRTLVAVANRARVGSQ